MALNFNNFRVTPANKMFLSHVCLDIHSYVTIKDTNYPEKKLPKSLKAQITNIIRSCNVGPPAYIFIED